MISSVSVANGDTLLSTPRNMSRDQFWWIRVLLAILSLFFVSAFMMLRDVHKLYGRMDDTIIIHQYSSRYEPFCVFILGMFACTLWVGLKRLHMTADNSTEEINLVLAHIVTNGLAFMCHILIYFITPYGIVDAFGYFYMFQFYSCNLVTLVLCFVQGGRSDSVVHNVAY
jgi:hypothetical protein